MNKSRLQSFRKHIRNTAQNLSKRILKNLNWQNIHIAKLGIKTLKIYINTDLYIGDIFNASNYLLFIPIEILCRCDLYVLRSLGWGMYIF